MNVKDRLLTILHFLAMRLVSRCRCTSELDNEVCFYDAVENSEDLSSDDESTNRIEENPRLRQLRSKLGLIYRRRAAIRNKKVRGHRLSQVEFYCVFPISSRETTLKKQIKINP